MLNLDNHFHKSENNEMKAHVNFIIRYIERRKENISGRYEHLSHLLELIIQEIKPKGSHQKTRSLFKAASVSGDICGEET